LQLLCHSPALATVRLFCAHRTFLGACASWVHTASMSELRRFHALRSKYRSARSAHLLTVSANKRLTQAGKQPTNEQLAAEQRAAEAVRHARAKLHAAIDQANGPYLPVSDRGIQAVALRYKAAFDAYHAIVAANARQALAGDPTSVYDLIRGEEARRALALAKRDLERLGSRASARPFSQKTGDCGGANRPPLDIFDDGQRIGSPRRGGAQAR
jgi:hypothetical protein